ncbi:hypothetical protein D3C75_1208870 [compost metagenome]
MVLTAHRLLVRSAVGDHHHHGFTAVLGTGAHHVHSGRTLVLVHLIEQPNVGPWAGLAFVGADRPEEGIGVRIKQVPDFFVAP